jgi:hypothetical protein
MTSTPFPLQMLQELPRLQMNTALHRPTRPRDEQAVTLQREGDEECIEEST